MSGIVGASAGARSARGEAGEEEGEQRKCLVVNGMGRVGAVRIDGTHPVIVGVGGGWLMG
jgi:hypothetical protein